MSIHYDVKLKRFRDSSGRLVSRARALKSSIARAEYQKALRKVSRAKPPAKAKGAAPKKPPTTTTKKATKRSTVKEARTLQAPWERQGIVKEYPDPEAWFPDIDHDDYDYGYDDLIDDWGDYGDDETDS